MKFLKVLFSFAILWGIVFAGQTFANGYGYGYTDYSNQKTIVCETKSEAWVYKKQPVSSLVTYWGYDWKKDRENLAKKVGIDNYYYNGTKDQNLQIKQYFLDKIVVKESSPVIVKDEVNYNFPVLKTTSTKAFQIKYHMVTYDIAKEFGLYWPTARFDLAKKLWIVNYSGTRTQNMKIREALINNTIVIK